MVEFDPLRSSFVALVGEELASFEGFVVRSQVSLRYLVWFVLVILIVQFLNFLPL